MRLVNSRTSRALRFRQGVILIAGAIVVAVVIGDSSSGFYYTPLALGLTYLAAALAGGSEGSYWATAVTLVGWGAAVVFVRQAHPNLGSSRRRGSRGRRSDNPETQRGCVDADRGYPRSTSDGGGVADGSSDYCAFATHRPPHHTTHLVQRS